MAKKQSAFMKPVSVSDALAEVVGSGPMPRTEVTKKFGNILRSINFKIQKINVELIQMRN